jgi:hypothetical protein
MSTRENDESEYAYGLTKGAASEPYDTTPVKPLLAQIGRLEKNITSLHKTIQVAYAQLDHLRYDEEVSETEVKPPEPGPVGSSSTVRRVSDLADQVSGAERSLSNLMHGLQA